MPFVSLALLLAAIGMVGVPVAAQAPSGLLPESSKEAPMSVEWPVQMTALKDAAIRLPIAALLSTVLAYRPRRRGTPKRQLAVIQTQIILAIVGAIVMLVVGASLARAFGIVGAAGLIRYRAKVDDPKDAGVMLSTLALGLASGVGQFALATFATVFVLLTLWILESLEPEPHVLFELAIKAKNASSIKPRVEQLLRRYRVPFDLRNTSPEDIAYEVQVPVSKHTDTISEAFNALEPNEAIEVKWERKKDK